MRQTQKKGVTMVTADDINKAVKDIQNHYNTNVNNKYVKNALLRMDVPLHVQQNKDYLLKGDLYYIDSRGAVEDLYMGVAATMDYIDMIVKHVMPHITFTGVDFVEGLGLENIVIPKSNYLILEARNEKDTMHDYRELLKQKIQLCAAKRFK